MTALLLKRLLAVLLVGAVSLTFANQASADFVYALTNTYLNANDGSGSGPPLPPAPQTSGGITKIDLSPLTFYTNTFSGAGTNSADVRTVFAATISAVHDDVSFGPPIHGPGSATTSITVLGAVEGTATESTPGVFTLNIQSGGFGLYQSTSPINPNNPTDPLKPFPTVATPFATFTLAPPAGVLPGSPHPSEAAQLTFEASGVNKSGLNTINPGLNQVVAAFNTTSDPLGFLGAGDPSGPQPPAGLVVHGGQAVESVDFTSLGSTSAQQTANLAVLNSIFAMYVPGALPTPPQWATGLGSGPDSNWNPAVVNNFPTTGDFRATGEGIQMLPFAPIPAPEPASVTLLGIGLGGFFLAIRRRKNKVQA